LSLAGASLHLRWYGGDWRTARSVGQHNIMKPSSTVSESLGEIPRETALNSGLSDYEVTKRRARGEGNKAPPPTGRTYSAIFRENVFTFINNVLFALCVALIVLHEASDALVAMGVVAGNILVSVVQEIRAKRTLDRVALLSRPRATVVRDGREREINPTEIVRGDILVAERGDQIVVDGPLVTPDSLEVDESLLTGEADVVVKHSGDVLYSGSFCVAGAGSYRADKVGEESFANSVTARARSFRRVSTPLQRQVNVIIRVILLVAIVFELILLAQAPLFHLSLVSSIKMSVVIAKLVPAGLFLSITLAYAIGAVRIARQGALVQQVNAIESLSNVDVLCMDKTGTLTANTLNLHALYPATVPEDELRQALGDFASSTASGNHTIDALVQAGGGMPQPVHDQISFSSERKWSALAFTAGRLRGSYVLGAPELLQHAVPVSPEIEAQDKSWSAAGLRTLLFAHAPHETSLHDQDGQPRLPHGLVPLGLVSFSDELRPQARDTLAQFLESGVALKIISGDNPQTVASLATQVGLGSDLDLVSGLDLATMDEALQASTVERATIFGRITPDQKAELVGMLKRNGHYVAMIGDGVNDVLSLKGADLGIAMESGSQATRAVADIVLIGDSFGILPSAVREGQRIRNGINDVLKLFIARVASVAVLLMAVMILGGFPFEPKHISVLTTLTVGIPSVALTAWAQPGVRARGDMLASLVHFVAPAALLTAAAGVGVYLIVALNGHGTLASYAETALTMIAVPCGLLLLPFVQPPTHWFEGGADYIGDWRPTILAVALFALFVMIFAISPVRSFLGFVPLSATMYGAIALIVVVWAIVLRFIWRKRLFERFLGIELSTNTSKRDIQSSGH
jgi:cation-transporting ATPase E